MDLIPYMSGHTFGLYMDIHSGCICLHIHSGCICLDIHSGCMCLDIHSSCMCFHIGEKSKRLKYKHTLTIPLLMLYCAVYFYL
jgi:hypothetical protein